VNPGSTASGRTPIVMINSSWPALWCWCPLMWLVLPSALARRPTGAHPA